MLRTLIRDKGNLVAERSDWIRRLQKGLDQMNVRLHRAVSDVDGATGMAILRAIAAGERDPRQLARLRDRGCRKTEEEIAEQLTGHWREDHLFSLRQSLQMYDAIEQRIADYDGEILRLLNRMTPEQRRQQSAPALKNQPKMRSLRKRGQEPARQALYRMSGVDMTQIDAVGVETVQIVLSEYGPDLSRFPNEKHFISHTTLAPRVPKSGNKPIRKKRRNSASRGGVAHGGLVGAPQSNRPRRLLPEHLAPDRSGCSCIRHGEETGQLHLPAPAMGPTIRR